MTHFLKGNIYWRIHHSNDIFFNLYVFKHFATSMSIQMN